MNYEDWILYGGITLLVAAVVVLAIVTGDANG